MYEHLSVNVWKNVWMSIWTLECACKWINEGICIIEEYFNEWINESMVECVHECIVNTDKDRS